MAKREKYLCYLFLNTGTKEEKKWARISKVQEFDFAYNPETETIDWIADQFAEDVIKSYKPSIDQEQHAYKEDSVYAYLEPKARKLAKGSDAETELLMVYDMQDDEGKNYASLYEANLIWTTDSIRGGILTYKIGCKGTPIYGTAGVTYNDIAKEYEPEFTPEVAV